MEYIFFGVAVDEPDHHAHCRVFVNGASAGRIVLMRKSNWWWRMWQFVLFGWRWHSLKDE